MKERKVARTIFNIILLLHVIACYAIGVLAISNPEMAASTGFQIDYSDSLGIPLLIIGMEVLFLGSIALLGIIWTRRGSVYGIYTGAAVGFYMLLFGIVLFMLKGRTDGILVDSTRGIVTLIAAYFAHRELKSKRNE